MLPTSNPLTLKRSVSMSIYTYEISRNLCEIFNIEFHKNECPNDQTLNVIPEESILGGTDYVSGMIWITDGVDNAYITPKDVIPNGWKRGRTIQYKLSKSELSQIARKSAEKQWENNTDRKKLMSEKIKNYWANNYESMAENSRKNGKHGMIGKLHPRALLLEYKGVNYYGWRELREATGVTKGLYKKYYLNGIDPEPRIGKDGPAASTSTADKIR